MKSLQHTIKAVVRPGEESGYVAERHEVAGVTQAVAWPFEEEAAPALGGTMDLQPAYA